MGVVDYLSDYLPPCLTYSPFYSPFYSASQSLFPNTSRCYLHRARYILSFITTRSHSRILLHTILEPVNHSSAHTRSHCKTPASPYRTDHHSHIHRHTLFEQAQT